MSTIWMNKSSLVFKVSRARLNNICQTLLYEFRRGCLIMWMWIISSALGVAEVWSPIHPVLSVRRYLSVLNFSMRGQSIYSFSEQESQLVPPPSQLVPPSQLYMFLIGNQILGFIFPFYFTKWTTQWAALMSPNNKVKDIPNNWRLQVANRLKFDTNLTFIFFVTFYFTPKHSKNCE